MSLATAPTNLAPDRSAALGEHLQVPASLRQQLLAYRRRVWTIKLIEASAVVLVAAGMIWLVAYGLERFFDTPAWLRGVLLVAALGAACLIPRALYRWVWSQRSLEQLARLLSRRIPAVGDSLLGVIELAHNHREQERSPTLCQAAMRQVAADAEQRDLLEAVPRSRHRSWLIAAGVILLIVVGVAIRYPAAAANTLHRLALPLGDTPRFTFTRIEALPSPWHIAHGEPIEFALPLREDTRQRPETGRLRIGAQPPLQVSLTENRYQAVLPPQITPQSLDVRIGDTRQRVMLQPTLRPELSSVVAEVQLPAYLQLPEPRRLDARGGSVAVVRGSTVRIRAEANRPLSAALIDDNPVSVEEARFAGDAQIVNEPGNLRLEWSDRYRLAGREPLELQITPREDEAPSLICDGLPRQAVLLDSELLKFQIRAGDDFGLRRVGLLWRGLPDAVVGEPAAGERVLAGGAPDKTAMEVSGTFSAASLGIDPQPIELRVWAEDYRPEGARVISSPYTLYILTPDEHAIWMTEQLSKWHRQALEVRDRELQLYEANKELRALPPEQREAEETRRRIERQAQAERSNGRRLAQLSQRGAELVKQASRNSEIGVGHLERWAEMLQILQEISAQRMPSVAELLDQAAQQPQLAAASPRPQGPQAGVDRSTPRPGGNPSEANDDAKQSDRPPAPTVVDSESSMNPPGEQQPREAGPPKKPNDPALRLPTTTLVGPGGKKPPAPQPPAEETPMDRAVQEQEDLLAEFAKIADELNAVLANLEGSTLVKRLKAASRKQYKLAGRITEQIEPAFGRREARLKEDVREVLGEMEEVEQQSVQEISYIMDDMAAYFERRRFARFQTVLEEMKEADVIGGLRELVVEISDQQGLSVAQAEYWSDALDRWAEDLVDPACSGQCPGGKSPASLPPSIVLEALQILEGEVNLREETRVAQQRREAVSLEDHMTEGLRLSDVQVGLETRVGDLIRRIGELPQARQHFAKEMQLLAQVEVAMGEATRLLAEPNTGPPAIAAETEAIELLLQSKRINPNSGGGGGSAPGGGSGDSKAADAALALLGSGTNAKEVRESRDVGQTTGESGTELPEEFRSGLDEYFNRIDSTEL